MNNEPHVIEFDGDDFQFEPTIVGSDPHQPLGKAVICGDEHWLRIRNDVQRASATDSVLSR